MRKLILIKKRKIAGQTLIETFIAVTVMALVVVSGLALVASTIQTATLDRQKIQAMNLAQEGLELARNYRDSVDWDTFKDFNPSALDQWQNIKFDDSIAGFTRDVLGEKISLGPGQDYYVRVTSRVSWTYKGQTKTVTLIEDFYNWQGR
jgi:type II secretory pathway pseudopilin PulG